MWYHEHIGGERCPIVDTWWQTETGRDHDHAAARRHADASPAPRRGRSPASTAEILDDRRRTTVDVGGGLLALTRPWPSMLRDDLRRPRALRATRTGASGGTGVYFTGDGAQARRGRLLLAARAASTTCMNVAGHRIGTMEVESALVDHPAVAEAAVVGTRARAEGTGHRRVRDAQGEGKPRGRRGRSTDELKAARRARRSARSPGPTTSSSRPTCPRRARARSCGACCATSPRAARSATRPRWPTPPWSPLSRISTRNGKADRSRAGQGWAGTRPFAKAVGSSLRNASRSWRASSARGSPTSA